MHEEFLLVARPIDDIPYISHTWDRDEAEHIWATWNKYHEDGETLEFWERITDDEFPTNDFDLYTMARRTVARRV